MNLMAEYYFNLQTIESQIDFKETISGNTQLRRQRQRISQCHCYWKKSHLEILYLLARM